MSVYYISVRLAACLALAAPSMSAVADTNATPHCEVNVSFNPIKTSPNTYSLGVMEQHCEAEQGYKIIAEGGEPLAGAVMLVSGRPVKFNEAGLAILINTDEPGRRNDSLVLTTLGGQPQTLAFRIEAHL